MGGNLVKKDGLRPDREIGSKDVGRLWNTYCKAYPSQTGGASVEDKFMTYELAIKFIKHLATALQLPFNKHRVRNWIQLLDPDRTGRVEYEKFEALFVQCCTFSPPIRRKGSSRIGLTSSLQSARTKDLDSSLLPAETAKGKLPSDDTRSEDSASSTSSSARGPCGCLSASKGASKALDRRRLKTSRAMIALRLETDAGDVPLEVAKRRDALRASRTHAKHRLVSAPDRGDDDTQEEGGECYKGETGDTGTRSSESPSDDVGVGDEEGCSGNFHKDGSLESFASSDFDTDDEFLYDSDEYASEDFLFDGVFTDNPDSFLPPDYDPMKSPFEKEMESGFLPPLGELRAVDILNDMQRRAMEHVVKKSKKESDEAYESVLERAKKMGFSSSEFDATLRYIRDEAPIIVHVNLDKVMGFFVKDTDYRNQFETATSGGTLSRTTREGWENRLFGGIYNVGCADYDRCKYGVLNVTNDPCGVQCCRYYGDSYLLLKNVRLRTTFANKDTSNSDVRLSCCEHYHHVLAAYTDKEFRTVMEVGCGRKTWAMSNALTAYKEVQIHGPLRFKDHVEAIVVNVKHKSQKKMVEQIHQFAVKNDCKVVWQERSW